MAQRVPSPAEEAFLRSRAAALSQVIEMRAMVRPEAGERLAMVELKAVDAAYPLLGRIELAAAEQLHALLADQDGAWGRSPGRPDRRSWVWSAAIASAWATPGSSCGARSSASRTGSPASPRSARA